MNDTAQPSVEDNLIGRRSELKLIEACLRAGRHVLLEGPVGVGKTCLAVAAARRIGVSVERVDGDGRYTEQKLTGWFDPPTAIRSGYGPDAFVPGPLVEAMRGGGVLLVNELNRLPEGVQNVLLPAMDERLLVVPRLGSVQAEAGFRVIATQNPREFVATSHLSEAILDRFELMKLDYQSKREELDIVLSNLQASPLTGAERERLASLSVRVVRATRDNPSIRRGASVRAAISIAEIGVSLMSTGVDLKQAVLEASRMALPTRIEMQRQSEDDETADPEREDRWIAELIDIQADPTKKKRTSRHLEIGGAPELSRHQSCDPLQTGFSEGEGRRLACYDEDIIPDLKAATDWDIAVRYTDFSVPLARGTRSEVAALRLRRVAATEILRRARNVLGAVARRTVHGLGPWPELPRTASRAELELEETLEQAPVEMAATAAGSYDEHPLWPEDLWMRYETHRRQPLVLCLDTSMSMLGENQALVAVAVAVVLLELPEDPIGVISFDDRVNVLKHPDEPVSALEVVERLLDAPGRPYTHIESGLRKALRLVGRTGGGRSRPISTLLLTDGKYTAGKDPAYLAAHFPHLIVLKMGTARTGLPLCRDLARRGNGTLRDVPSLTSLPTAMYRVVQDLMRSRSC